MASASLPQATIFDGPSKYDWMLGLFENSTRNPRSVEFTLRRSPSDNVGPDALITVSLLSLERRDGSNERWLFEGEALGIGTVRGFFSTQNRRGYLSFTKLHHIRVRSIPEWLKRMLDRTS